MRRKGWILIPICVAVLFIIIFKTVFLMGYVPSASMEPTLKEGSIILGVRHYGELKTGDVIIFEYDNQLLVKRIAAIGGENIEIDGVKYTVPQESYYVLGDNPEKSIDSRFWTEPFITQDQIKAKVVLI